MKTHDFPPYSPASYYCPVTVVLERITHFYPVNYNGNSGTALVLDTDKEVVTSMRSGEVKKILEGVSFND